jgi:23S rRNA (cytosine1962-C5)-methyltransferase
VFSNEIETNASAKALVPGSVVNVVGHDGQVFGSGYYNPASLIAVRLLDSMADRNFDAAFFQMRISRALALREAVYNAPFYRLVHAEGDFLPGLTIDRIGDTCVVQVSTAGMEYLLEPLLEGIDAALAPRNLVLRADAPSRALEGLECYVRTVRGQAGRTLVEENGLHYFVDLKAGQKTGWYYDQRTNRAFAMTLASGNSVLDAYTYTGGFALAAAKAGAREVVALDSSAPALALGEDSAASNKLSVRFVRCDVTEELERLGAAKETFDIVIADPPPFVKSRKDLEAGARAYRKLARLASHLVSRGGFMLLASCSHNISDERFALECALGIRKAGRNARLIRRSGAGADHPIHPMLPETAYLKTMVYAMD